MTIQNSRAVAAPSTGRAFANFLFMSALTAGVVLATHTVSLPKAETVEHAVAAVKHAVTPKPAPVPAGPSAYELESAMSTGALMKRWDTLISEAALKFAVPERWIRAVMRMESGGRTMLGENQPITSSAGAVGLMQVMPETYAEMRSQYGLGADPTNPRDNVFAGAAYLHWLHARYGYPAMFAAYNAGPGALENHLARGTPLPAETRNYVTGVAGILGSKLSRAVGGVTGTAMLTRPDGTALKIDRTQVRSIRAAMPGEYADGVQSVITIGKRRQGIRESVAAATELAMSPSRQRVTAVY